jgi:hypothetical protein
MTRSDTSELRVSATGDWHPDALVNTTFQLILELGGQLQWPYRGGGERGFDWQSRKYGRTVRRLSTTSPNTSG